MLNGFVLLVVGSDFTCPPELAESGAGREQVADQLAQLLVIGILPKARSQVRDDALLKQPLFPGRPQDPGGQAGEVAPDLVPLAFGTLVRVTEDRGPHRVPDNRAPARVVDGRRVSGQLANHAAQAVRNCLVSSRAVLRRLASKEEQVDPFNVRQPEGPAQRGEYLRGRRLGSPLLKLGQVVDGDTRKLGDLLAAQPVGLPARGNSHPEVPWVQPLPPVAQSRAKLAGRNSHDVDFTLGHLGGDVSTTQCPTARVSGRFSLATGLIEPPDGPQCSQARTDLLFL